VSGIAILPEYRDHDNRFRVDLFVSSQFTLMMLDGRYVNIARNCIILRFDRGDNEEPNNPCDVDLRGITQVIILIDQSVLDSIM